MSNHNSEESSLQSPLTRRRSWPKRRASYAPKWTAKHRRLLGVVVVLVLAAFAAISLLALEPPDPLPASTKASEFSAERAFSHVEQIADRPHPVGSEANAEVRDYLVEQLEDLGLRPTVQEATSARTKEGIASIARVHNIHARIPGSAPTGHVVLRHAPEELALATWAWFVVLAILTAAFVPGASYLYTWTPLAGGLLLAPALRWGGQEPTWRYLASGAAAVPAVALLVPLVDLLFSLGLAFASGPMFMAVLVLVTALPVLELLAIRRAWLVPVAAVVGLALTAAGLRIDTFDDEHPRQTRLVYALDADREQAWWLSADPHPAPWTERYVDKERIEDDRFPDSPSLSLASRYYSGPASVARIEPPDVRVTRSERDGDMRELRLRITPAEASRLALYADTRRHTVTAATVDGIDVEKVPGQRQDTDPSKWGFVFHGGRPRGSR